MTLRASDLLPEAIAELRAAGVPDPVRDARLLMAVALSVAPARLTLVLPDPISEPARLRYRALITRRALREPISHLTGTRQFYGRDFQVTTAVLDPRPETETLIEVALADPFASVLDLGTGSGCILLTLLAERAQAVGVGVDLSARALEVAGANARALGLEARSALAEGSWYAPVPRGETFDLIVSNPPYIAAEEMPGLSPEVRLHEPRMALTDEADGLSAYRLIAAGAQEHLDPEGRLIVEIGPTQGAAVAEMLREGGLSQVHIVQDMDGRDRVVIGRNCPHRA